MSFLWQGVGGEMKYCCEKFEMGIKEGTVAQIENYFHGLKFHILEDSKKIDDPNFPSPISSWRIMDSCNFCGKELK